MKRLYLLRHAKSSWNEPDLADFDRPLNQRGVQAAPFMGRLMAVRDYLPDLIVSSPARRAFTTAQLVRDGAQFKQEAGLDDRVYEASPQTLLQIAAGFDEAAVSAMLVGHNPGMEGFVRLLTRRSEAMPTAALAVIDLAIERWVEITEGSGTLIEVIRPKEHMTI